MVARRTASLGILVLATLLPASTRGQEARIEVRADHDLHRLSPYLKGACIEDVNHEIYGGLYSQMIFGESFQEPAPPLPLKGFTAYGGQWTPSEGVLRAAAGDGPKLIDGGPEFAEGEVGVEILFPEGVNGNAGLILKVRDAGVGADRFTGYEVALEGTGTLVLGRHRQNWEFLRSVPCRVKVGEWNTLVVRLTARTLEVLVNGESLTRFEDAEHPLESGRVGLRTWRRAASFRNLRITTGGETRPVAFEAAEPDAFGGGVSGMWRPVRRGSASGTFGLESQQPLVGRQSQLVRLESGAGAIGIENQSLNRWGMHFVGGKPYEGYVWIRAEHACRVALALEDRTGDRRYADTTLEVPAGGWKRHEFTLTPEADETTGRFTLELREPGSVVVGHAYLQPGEWGRFHGLPVRRDVAEALQAQGLTVLRYGGSMINHPAYRWKNMIGPRDLRPPTEGTWYPYSTNGWGIPDFLNFCEAAGFLAIPAFNMGETPQDMLDFLEYANGPVDSPWGRKRAADGHPKPYRLRYIELGNEEAVNEAYWQKFRPIAEALWARDRDLTLVVGDFAYNQVIEDPFHFEGGAAVNSLATHKQLLEFAKQHGRELWFDIHVWTEQPPAPNGLRVEQSYIEQLQKLVPDAKFQVAIFEFNANNHALKRALSNATAMNAVQRLARHIPVACSANCLQPDGQNDNGWDQGLLFLNPSSTWLQPPGDVIRMVARHDQPRLVASELKDPAATLDVTATRSDDGKVLVLKVVNTGDTARPTRLQFEGFTPSRPTVRVETLAGDLEAVNTAEQPDRIRPVESEWHHGLTQGAATYAFPPHSFTILRLE